MAWKSLALNGCCTRCMTAGITLGLVLGISMTGLATAHYKRQTVELQQKQEIDILNWNIFGNKEVKEHKAWKAAYYSLSDSVITYKPQSLTEYNQLVGAWHQKSFEAYTEVMDGK